jgi:excisionase family DNA binding protein
MSTSHSARYRGITLEPLMTEAEVMDILKVSRPKIRELVREGQLPAVVFMRHRRYLKQDVVDFVEGSAPRHSAKRRLMMAPRHELKWTASAVSKDLRL